MSSKDLIELQQMKNDILTISSHQRRTSSKFSITDSGEDSNSRNLPKNFQLPSVSNLERDNMFKKEPSSTCSQFARLESNLDRVPNNDVVSQIISENSDEEKMSSSLESSLPSQSSYNSNESSGKSRTSSL